MKFAKNMPLPFKNLRNAVTLLSLFGLSLSLSCIMRPDFRYTNIDRDRRREATRSNDGQADDPTLISRSDGRRSFMDESTFADFSDQIRRFWQAPYLWGGLSTQGIDCSGLVYVIYKNGLKVNVPRSTHELYRGGKTVAKREVRISDLVFFSLQSRIQPDHVGIYIARGFFLHASISRGVTLSHLDDSPFKNNYLGARRYFE